MAIIIDENRKRSLVHASWNFGFNLFLHNSNKIQIGKSENDEEICMKEKFYSDIFNSKSKILQIIILWLLHISS